MMTENKRCSACGGPASTAAAGTAGAARVAGLCYPCWRERNAPKGGGKRARPARAAGTSSGPFAEFEAALTRIVDEEIGGIVGDTRDLLDRVFARLDGIRRKRAQLAGIMRGVEKRVRDAAAELRRETKRLRRAAAIARSERARLPVPEAERHAALDEKAEECAP